MSGIRLNVGLVKYRRGDYAGAVAPLASVVRDQPDSQQARYLLGYVLRLHRALRRRRHCSRAALDSMSNDFTYLYVLGIAAHNAGKNDLDGKALSRLVEVGGETPEFHLILGKAYLNREEIDKAISELELAASKNANLPFVHFSLGVAYMRKEDNERAEAEFRKDIAIEPDLPDNYEQLGLLYLKMQKDEEAERSFREALHYNPRLPGSYLALGLPLSAPRKKSRSSHSSQCRGKTRTRQSKCPFRSRASSSTVRPPSRSRGRAGHIQKAARCRSEQTTGKVRRFARS